MPSLTSAHSIRNPGKRVQPIKQRQKVLSHAEKQSRALAAAQNKINSDNLQAELNEHFELREETIDRLATKYKKTDKYIRKLICSSTRSKQVRKANLYNAYVHDLFEKEIAAGGHKTLRELQEEVKARMEDAGVSHVKDLISDEEIVRLRGELKDATELKRVGIRATNKVAAMDSYQTVKNMAEGAMNLFERVGVRGFALFSRGNPEDPSVPHCFDSDGALDFCLEILGFSKVDLLRMFEAWNCARDGGGRNSNDVNALRKEIVKLIEDSLRKTVKDKNAKMSYKNYDVDIRAGMEVELAGWPAGIDFVRPAKIHQMGELRRIRDGLRNGQIRWVYLTRSQLDALEAELDERRKAGPLKKRAPRSDKGKKRGPRKNNNKVADHDSNDENDDDDDYDDDNADDETTAPAAVITTTTTRAAPISNTVHMRATTPTAAHAADATPVNTTPATTRAAEPTPANAADATPINTTPTTRAAEARPANAAPTATHAADAVHANIAPTAVHVTDAARASVNAAGATPVGAANVTTVPLGPAASAFTVFTVNVGHSAGSNVASKPRKKRSDAGRKRKRSTDENLDPNATAPPANHDRGNTGLDTAEPAAKRQKCATKTAAAATISAAIAADMI